MLLLLAKHRFRKIDRLFLYALGQYGYLNAYLLRRYASVHGFQGIDQAFVKDRMTFLLKHGLVFRYEFFHKDKESAAVNGSPFVYGLSGGGWMFLKMSYRMHLASSGMRSFYDFPDLNDQQRLSQVLGLLSENQFAILFEDQYEKRVRMSAEVNGEAFSACGQRMEYHITFSGGRSLQLFPVAVRQCGAWENALLKRLSDIKTYCKKQGYVSFSVLVLCETSEHALACEKLKQSNRALSRMDVFYGLDHTIAGSPDVFGRMLEVKKSGEHLTRSYFRLDFGMDAVR